MFKATTDFEGNVAIGRRAIDMMSSARMPSATFMKKVGLMRARAAAKDAEG